MNATEEDLEKVIIEILDEDIGNDSSLGKALLKLEKNSKIQTKWIPLENCKSGEILVSVNAEDQEIHGVPTEKTRVTFTINQAKDLEKSDYIPDE